jgi:hypothetical protein
LEELSRSGVHLSLPLALVDAAERIVKAMVANPNRQDGLLGAITGKRRRPARTNVDL